MQWNNQRTSCFCKKVGRYPDFVWASCGPIVRYVCELRHQASVALTCTGEQACCFPASGRGSESGRPHSLENLSSASCSLATLWGILAKPTTGEGCSCQCGMDIFCAHSLHLSVQAWARKVSWAAILKCSLSTSEGWRRSVVVAEYRVYRQGPGSALVVDVEQRTLLAGHKLGRGQHARGLHRDVHSRGAGVGAVLHLRPRCSRLKGPVGAAVDHDTDSGDARVGAALHQCISTIGLRVLAQQCSCEPLSRQPASTSGAALHRFTSRERQACPCSCNTQTKLLRFVLHRLCATTRSMRASATVTWTWRSAQRVTATPVALPRQQQRRCGGCQATLAGTLAS